MSSRTAICTGWRRLVSAIALVAAPTASGSPFTETPPTSAGAAPFALTPAGGIVVDIVAANGNRVTAQLTANSLAGNANYNFSPVPLGTLGGFNDAVTNPLGGAINELAVRLTVQDWDNAAGELDDGAHMLRINGIDFGDPSAAPAQATDATGNPTGAGTSAGGFRNNLLDTGWLLNTDPATLAAILASIEASDQLVFDYTDVSANGNGADFSRGVDAATAGLTLGPVVVLAPPPPPPPPPPPTLADAARTPTQREVARVVDAQAGAGNELDAVRINVLSLSSEDAQRAALDALAGRITFLAGDHAIGSAEAQAFNIDSRLNALRRGGPASDAGRVSLAFADDPLGVRDAWPRHERADDPAIVSDAAPGLPLAGVPGGLPEQRWGVYALGAITLTDADGSGGSSSAQLGYDATTTGLTLGVDTRLDTRTVVGIAVGFADASADFDDGSTFDAQSASVSLYATRTLADAWYIDAAVAYTYADVELDRLIIVPGVDRTGRGRTHSHGFSAHGRIVYEHTHGPWVLAPEASLRYADATVAGYTESGAGGVGLSYDDQRARSLRANVGATLRRTWSLGRGRAITPYVGLALETELLDDARSITTAFVDDPATPFTTFTDESDDVFGRATLGVTARLGGGWSGYADYQALLGNDDAEAHTFFGGLRLGF